MRKNEGKKKNIVEEIKEGDIKDAVLFKWTDEGIDVGLTQKGVVLIKRGHSFNRIIERRVTVKEGDMNVSKMEYMQVHVSYVSNKLLREIKERETDAIKRRGRDLLARAKRDELKKKYVEKLEKELKEEKAKPDCEDCAGNDECGGECPPGMKETPAPASAIGDCPSCIHKEELENGGWTCNDDGCHYEPKKAPAKKEPEKKEEEGKKDDRRGEEEG